MKSFLIRRILCDEIAPQQCHLFVPVEFFAYAPFSKYVEEKKTGSLAHMIAEETKRYISALHKRGFVVLEIKFHIPGNDSELLEEKIRELFPQRKKNITVGRGVNFVLGDTRDDLPWETIEKQIDDFIEAKETMPVL